MPTGKIDIIAQRSAALAYIAHHPDCAGLDLRFDVILIAHRCWLKFLPDTWRPRE